MNRRGLRKALALLGPKTKGEWRAWREERGGGAVCPRSIGRAASAFSFSHIPSFPPGSCPASSPGPAPHVRGQTDGDRRPYPYRPRRTSPSGSGIQRETEGSSREKKKRLDYKHIQIQAGVGRQLSECCSSGACQWRWLGWLMSIHPYNQTTKRRHSIYFPFRSKKLNGAFSVSSPANALLIRMQRLTNASLFFTRQEALVLSNTSPRSILLITSSLCHPVNFVMAAFHSEHHPNSSAPNMGGMSGLGL
uniref:Uncharacterized protein n=1 Tax=Oryza meridionalis TaxID=40149 RepID=A0A0E0D5T2_9ORYZ